MLTSAWFPMRYHREQSLLWRTRARYVAVAAGRGSGKTETARRRVVRYLPVRKPWSDPLYFYALPTYKQARRVAWRPIKALVPREWIRKCNDSEMRIETVFGSTLYVVGLDKPERIEGSQWDGGVVDESSDQKPGAFEKSILPALTHRDGWCWRIGVPKRFGIGAKEFKEICEKWADSSDPMTASFSWPSSTVLTPEQLRWAMENNDPRNFNEQYNATWESASGLMFYAFDGRLNVSREAEYDPGRPIFVGQDFNVDPMCWTLGHLDDPVVYFDELCIRNTNTQESLDALYKRYENHAGGWEFYGDASGRARKTSATFSDYAIIKNDRRFSPKGVYYLRSNPRVVDRVAAFNAMCRNAAGDRRLLVHPRCVNLIRDLGDRAWREGTREADDYGDLGHMSDAASYPIYYRHPLRPQFEDAAAEVHLG